MPLDNNDFARTSPEKKDRAATTWAKDSVEKLKRNTLKLAPILATLENARGTSAAVLNTKALKGSSDTQITALQGALKILHERNPSRYLDPGKIDGVYANVKNGQPNLARSRTAAAMEAITGIRYIDENSIAKVLDALNTSNAAAAVRTEIIDTGMQDDRLQRLRGTLPTFETEKGFEVSSYGFKMQIEEMRSGKFQVKNLPILFESQGDAIKAANFLAFCFTEFKKKGATDTPWHVQVGSRDLEFDTANSSATDMINIGKEFANDPFAAFDRNYQKLKNMGGLIDTEVTDNNNEKLPQTLLAPGNISLLVQYLNNTPNWWKKSD